MSAELRQVIAQGASGAISATLKVPGGMPWARLISVHVILGGDSSAEDLVISKDSGLGAAFDATLYTKAMSGESECCWYTEDKIYLRAATDFDSYGGDAVKITHTNTADDSWAIEAIFQQVG